MFARRSLARPARFLRAAVVRTRAAASVATRSPCGLWGSRSLSALASSGTGGAASAASPLARADYRPPTFEVPSVSLTFDLFDDHADVTSEFVVERLPWFTPAPLQLDGDPTVALVSLSINGVPCTQYTVSNSGHKLAIPHEVAFAGGDAATVRIVTRVKPQENLQLSGLCARPPLRCPPLQHIARVLRRLAPARAAGAVATGTAPRACRYRSAGGFFTQCEAKGFSRITFWPDRPDIL